MRTQKKKFRGGHSCRGGGGSVTIGQEGGMPLSQDGILPSGGDIPPSEGGILLPEDGILPSGGGIQPLEGGILPPEGGMMTEEGGMPPSEGGFFTFWGRYATFEEWHFWGRHYAYCGLYHVLNMTSRATSAPWIAFSGAAIGAHEGASEADGRARTQCAPPWVRPCL